MRHLSSTLRGFVLSLCLIVASVIPVDAFASQVSISRGDVTDTLSFSYSSQRAPKLFTAQNYVLVSIEGVKLDETPKLSSDGIEFVQHEGGVIVVIAKRQSLDWKYELEDKNVVSFELKLAPPNFSSHQFSGIPLQVIDQFRMMSFAEIESTEIQRVILGAQPLDRLVTSLSDYGDYMRQLYQSVQDGDLSEEAALQKAKQVRDDILRQYSQKEAANE